MKKYAIYGAGLAIVAMAFAFTPSGNNLKTGQGSESGTSDGDNQPRYLVKDIYIADPSAHVFDGKIYVYPSHDIESGIPENDNGDHFAMRDYHVFSMESIDGKVTDHGIALAIEDVPWAGRQMWAPDAAEKGGKYYLYFPVKDKTDIFHIGVAVSNKPEGAF